MDMKIESIEEQGWKNNTSVPVKEKDASTAKSRQTENTPSPEKPALETAKNADNTIKGLGGTILRYDLVDKEGQTAKKLIVSVIDEETGKVIRRIPPDELKAESKGEAGIILDKKG